MTDEIEDYTIADGTDAHTLIQNVRALMNDGWAPLGGFMLAIDSDPPEGHARYNLGQAMVRPKKRIQTIN